MRPALTAAVAYFALVFAAGFAMGTLRTLVLAPAMGELAAVAAELPVMLAISWWACGMALRHWSVPARLAVRLIMGLLAFGLLLLAETALSLALGGLALRQHLALYETLPVQLGLVGQILFAAFPTIRRMAP